MSFGPTLWILLPRSGSVIDTSKGAAWAIALQTQVVGVDCGVFSVVEGARGRGLQVADVLAEVAASDPRAGWAMALVLSCKRALGAAGVGLAVADADGPVGVAAATPGVGQLGEDLQFALGEGPCRSATQTGLVVRAPDLASDDRWLRYAHEASGAGIAGAFSVPLLVGAIRVGVLDLYRSTAGPLAVADEQALLIHAEAATAVLLQQDTAVHGEDGVELTELADIRPVVRQAAGMVAIQVDVDLTVAMLRLRAHAYSVGVPLREVAAKVVARRLVFDDSAAGFRLRDEGGR